MIPLYKERKENKENKSYKEQKVYYICKKKKNLVLMITIKSIKK